MVVVQYAKFEPFLLFSYRSKSWSGYNTLQKWWQWVSVILNIITEYHIARCIQVTGCVLIIRVASGKFMRVFSFKRLHSIALSFYILFYDMILGLGIFHVTDKETLKIRACNEQIEAGFQWEAFITYHFCATINSFPASVSDWVSLRENDYRFHLF